MADHFQSTTDTITAVSDRVQTTMGVLRDGIRTLGELDEVSQDMLIAISAPLEKHLWMLQAHEL